MFLLCSYLQKHREVLFCATPDALEHFKAIEYVTCVEHQLRMLFFQIPQLEQPAMLVFILFQVCCQNKYFREANRLKSYTTTNLMSLSNSIPITLLLSILREAGRSSEIRLKYVE